jgi:hypothetical protein
MSPLVAVWFTTSAGTALLDPTTCSAAVGVLPPMLMPILPIWSWVIGAGM